MTASLGAPDIASPRRRTLGAAVGWTGILSVVGLVVAPVVVIVASLVDPTPGLWSELWQTRLPGMIVDTLVLLILVVGGTAVLGAALAWVVTAWEFPGRRLVGWLLVVPLTIPGYVAGFVWLDTLAGPLGARGVRSIGVCAAVLIMTLYPYVYLFARATFGAHGSTLVDVARTLGLGPVATFVRVALPAARPGLAAGCALVMMEVLTDVGTVRLFNVSTVADGVLRVWFGTGNRQAAAELAATLVVAAVALVLFERFLRGGAAYSRRAASRPVVPRRLGRRAVATLLTGCVGVLVVAVGIPIVRLVSWALDAHRRGETATVSGGLWHHLGATLSVTALAVMACVSLGTMLALVARRHRRTGWIATRLSSLGYAMPGPVVAVGTVITLAALDRVGLVPGGAVLVGSLVGVVFALTVRFLAVAINGAESGLDQIPRNAVSSARVLGARPLRVIWSIEIPSTRTALLAATALLTIDVVKELPITLLLRPFGFDTLAVWVWQATSESLWAQAALPSLLIIAVGTVAVGALLVAIERGAEVVS